MVVDTAISWTQSDDGKRGSTWNPTDGCECCSPGCKNCYAMRMAGRFSGPGKPYHGLVTITAKGKHKGKAVWNGQGRLNKKALRKPLSWRDGRRVFVNSMSDLFWERFTNEEIAAVFGVMAASPRHTFQVLTKRGLRLELWYAWLDEAARRLSNGRAPEDPWWRVLVCLIQASIALGRVRDVEVMPDGALRVTLPNGKVANENATGKHGMLPGAHAATWPLQNVWVGVSVDDRKHGIPRIDSLRKIPAVVRFLSCEPLLEDLGALNLAGIGWLIAGCESGPGARACELEWIRSLRDQARAAEVPFFLKQSELKIEHVEYTGDMAGCRGKTFPREAIRVGPGTFKKGRGKSGPVYELPYLDNVQHRAFPKVPEARAA